MLRHNVTALPRLPSVASVTVSLTWCLSGDAKQMPSGNSLHGKLSIEPELSTTHMMFGGTGLAENASRSSARATLHNATVAIRV